MAEATRPVWEASGDTDALQQWLKDHSCHGVDAMRVLGCDLREAQHAFCDAPCRQAEREFQNQVMEGLEATCGDL
ncbi:hypothetical protein [Streptomyces sp. NPDC002133]|uniref:hypothetical protein n=1 Tax=Streptomyces sp. NPDC002133 TaxID=3154409 RepID=UPI0033338219